ATAPPRGSDEFCLTAASHMSCCPQESSAVPDPSPAKSTRICSAIPLLGSGPVFSAHPVSIHFRVPRLAARDPEAPRWLRIRQGWAARTGFQDRPPGFSGVELTDGTV